MTNKIEESIQRQLQNKKDYDKRLKEETKLPECFLGHILIESELEDVEAYWKQKNGVSKDSLIVIPKDITSQYDTPTKTGKIVKMAPDTFGKWFQDKYGDIGYLPQVGDKVIYLTPTATYIDIERKFALIPETSIKAYYKGDTNE